MKLFKKLNVILLCISLVFTALPVLAVNAEEDDPSSGDTIIDAQYAIDISHTYTDMDFIQFGTPLFYDSKFEYTMNGMEIYNNEDNSAVTLKKVSADSDCPTAASSMVKVTTTGTAEPGLGGFSQKFRPYDACALYYHVVIAKIPTGYRFSRTSNSLGYQSEVEYLTPREGTGKWELYIYRTRYGFFYPSNNTAGYVFLEGSTASADVPVEWYVGYSNVFAEDFVIQGGLSDPSFAEGLNGVFRYNRYNNNSSVNENVTVSRVAASEDCPSTSGYMLHIQVDPGTTCPGLGGFSQSVQPTEGKVYYHRFLAKIPQGYRLEPKWNGGFVANLDWITTNSGTGSWQTYIYKFSNTKIINSPYGSTFGYVALYPDGMESTGVEDECEISQTIEWEIAYSAIYGGYEFGSDFKYRDLSITAKTRYGNSMYCLFDYPLNWNTAKMLCEKMGGHLVTITDAVEQNAIKNLSDYGALTGYWIGATDAYSEGEYHWVTGEPFSYTAWASNQPDNSTRYCLDGEDYLEQQPELNGWNDAYSTIGDRGFICEFDDTAESSKTVEYKGHTYSLYNRQLSWTQAEAFCVQQGGHLISINTAEEQRFVEDLLAYGAADNYWIGFTDKEQEGKWVWTSGETTTYTKWASEQPDNYNNQEHYAHLYNRYTLPERWGLWNDLPDEFTSESIGFICEIGRNSVPDRIEMYNGHIYSLYNDSCTWTQAKKICEDNGGHLATITDAVEQEFVARLTEGQAKDNYWIGCTDVENEGRWQWVTGEKFDYANWQSGKPDNTSHPDDYGVIKTDGSWKDCANEESFINSVEADEVGPWSEIDGRSIYLKVYTSGTTDNNIYGREVIVNQNGYVTNISPYGVAGNHTVPVGGFIISCWSSNAKYESFVCQISVGDYIVLNRDTKMLYNYGKHEYTPASIGFICETETDTFKSAASGYYGSSFYEVYSNMVTWTDANAFAESKGGHLVTLANAEENAFVSALAASTNPSSIVVWIGGERYPDESCFHWVTGEPWPYENWGSGEPNNDGGQEFYVQLIYGHSTFNDAPNRPGRPFVVEYDNTWDSYENYAWQFDGKKLTVTGSGNISDIESVIGHPWFSHIAEVSIESDGITLSAHTFDNTQWNDNLPDGLVMLNHILYDYCGEIPQGTTLEIPQGTVSVAEKALQNQQGIIAVIVPESVASIGEGAFAGCDSMETVYGKFATSAEELARACNVEFVPKTVQIVLNAEGGILDTNTITVIKGAAFGTLPIPFRSGYDFLGWYTQKELGEQVTEETICQNECTLFARWKQLKKISLQTQPNRMQYRVGDTFDATGSVFLLQYTDGTTRMESADLFTFSPTVFTTAGTKGVVASYNGLKTSFCVLVTDVTLTGIQIVSLPVKTEYQIGETLNAAGLMVLATYDGAEEKDVTDNCEINCDLTATGNRLVTVSYTEKDVTVSATFTVTVSYSQSVATVFADPIQATPGQTVSIPVRITDNPGFLGFSIYAHFDPEVFTPLSVTPGELISGSFLIDSIGSDEDGQIKIVCYGSDNIYDDGVLFIINFKVNENAAGDQIIQLSYNADDTFNEAYEEVLLRCEIIDVNIAGTKTPEFYGHEAQVFSGNEVTVPIYLRNASAMTSFSIKLEYDSNVLQLQKITASDNCDSLRVNGSNIFYSGEAIENGIIAYLTFGAAQHMQTDTEVEIICLSSQNFGETARGSRFTIRVIEDTNPLLYAEQTAVVPGQTVSVPVCIRNNPGVMGMGVFIKYDPDILSLQSVEEIEAISFFDYNVQDNTGHSKVVWFCSDNITQDGALFYMRFEVNENSIVDKTKVQITESQSDTFDEEMNDVKLNSYPAIILIEHLQIVSEATTIWEGDTLRLSASYMHGTLETGNLIWSSGNDQIATIDKNGLLKAKRHGNVKITVTDANGNTAESVIQILPKTAFLQIISYDGSFEQKIKWWKKYSDATMNLGFQTYNCNGAVRFVWSTNSNRVDIDQDGNITNTGSFARSAKITLTAYDADGNVVASSTVTVRFYKFNWQHKRLQSQEIVSDNVFKTAVEVNESEPETFVSFLSAFFSKVFWFLSF